MAVQETLSEFVQRPTKVIARLDEGDIRLTRRDGEDLVLRRADDAERDAEILGDVATLFAALLKDSQLKPIVRAHVATAFPWAEFLPRREAERFSADFVRVARGCASVGNFAKLRIFLSSWQDTAAIYADPKQLANARRETRSADLVPVPDPRAEA